MHSVHSLRVRHFHPLDAAVLAELSKPRTTLYHGRYQVVMVDAELGARIIRGLARL